MLHTTISPDTTAEVDRRTVILAAHRAVATAAVADAQTIFERERGSVTATYEPLARGVVRHEREMAALESCAEGAGSPSLARLIRAAAVKKAEAYALERPHNILQYVELNLRSADTPDEAHALAVEQERAGEKAWQDARTEAELAGIAVTEAPFADLNDILLRADAYAQVVGCDDDGNVHFDEDAAVMYRSLRYGIEEIVSRQPDRTAWDVAAEGYRRINQTLDDLGRQEEKIEAGMIHLDPPVLEQFHLDMKDAYDRKDALGNAILAMDPPDAGGLLVQMDVVFDRGHGLDVSKYERRSSALNEEQRRIDGQPLMTVERLETQEANEFHRSGADQGLALLARSAATLRDREMPRDWRELFDTLGWMHKNARDAARQAIRAGVDATAFSGIHFEEGSEGRWAPSISFNALGGPQVFSNPVGCWKAGPVL